MSNSVLFQPFKMHDLTLSNRVVLAPLTRCRAGNSRLPNELMATYYSQRSSAGLLISEATAISEEAYGCINAPGIYSDAMFAFTNAITRSLVLTAKVLRLRFMGLAVAAFVAAGATEGLAATGGAVVPPNAAVTLARVWSI